MSAVLTSAATVPPPITIPYSRPALDEADIAAVCAVLRGEFLTMGPAVPAFEEAFAQVHDTPHTVAVGSATAALHLACVALGIGPGKRVWTVPNSFVASANCARYCGAEVDFVDIDPHTRNLSIAALDAKLHLARAAQRLPDLLIPVDFAGLPADLAAMRERADRFGFRILEDASHATGASTQGRPVGSAWADATVFSFHAVKVITTAEGGMVTTRDAALAARLRRLRQHGITREATQMGTPPEGAWVYEQQELGFNARMSDVQAALGLSQLRRLSQLHTRRETLAARYDRALARLPLRLPPRLPGRVSAWHLYAVQLAAPAGAPTRAEVFAALRQAGIGVNVHYIPIHTQPYWRARGFQRGDFPAAEAWYADALSLPLHPALTDAQQDRVIDAMQALLGPWSRT